MRLQPNTIAATTERIARLYGMRRVTRQHLFRIRSGKAKATENTIFLIVTALQEMTGLAVNAADVFRVQPVLTPGMPAMNGRTFGDWLFSLRRHEVWRLRMRDEEASPDQVSVQLERMYDDHAALLRATAQLRHGIPPQDADELVQDIFLSWYARQPRVDDMRAYLLAATNNACMYYWRKRSRETPLLEEHETRGDDGTTRTDRWIVRLSLGATLSALGAKCRETLRRYYIGEESTEKIAADFRTSPAYVRQILHTCRKRAAEIYRRLTEPR